ncbi:calcium-translocating P-type ATPase, PMCA-type [Candidatus Woesearchaeota archaeon]|nr:calcium-translocating P-type ATPase, PMCA-type [Candidatus Woesearchaeota archaeon]
MKNEGLTSKEAKERLEKYGKNEITRSVKVSPLKIFLSQFTSPLILILVAAAVISFVVGYLPGQEHRIVDTVLIFAIVLASGISGFLQDYKAEKTIEALQEMAVPKAKVIRDGKETEVLSTEIVPGDIVILESGSRIPADAKIVSCFNLETDESILTGESKAVKKKDSDEVFMNTFVYVGSAKVLVEKTGMSAKVGQIASKLQEIKEEQTPFQSEMASFGKEIFWIIIAITAVIFVISMTKYNLYESLLTSISLAVAAIPEGLPAVITLALAIGANSMLKKNALVRHLITTESVGAVDIICTDKTGTLTKNQMTVTRIFFNNKEINAQKATEKELESAGQLFLCGALCNNSSIGSDEKGNKKYLGDQTEIALRRISDRLGNIKEELEKKYEKVNEISFTSKRKMMSVVYKYENKLFVYSKGAPEVIIEKCDRIYKNGKVVKLSSSDKKNILEQNKKFASKALRILGFAFKETKDKEKGIEKGLIFLGLQAMIDPPRKEVGESIKECYSAGIRVIMMTGDNPFTAKAIADEVGIKSSGALEGKDIDKVNDKKLEDMLKKDINIFARMSPFHKLRVLEILMKKDRIAMTGDGVNDALALKKADVGIAMGIRGTEVAKEASDMILSDDNFSTIISAVKEGRRIFDNIRKFVNYLFVCNIAEVLVILLSTIFIKLKDPILLPVQLLWINLLTDGMPALALGVDPARADVMKRPPRKKNEKIMNNQIKWFIGVIGVKKTAILLATFFIILPFGADKARTALFTGFVLYEFVRIGAIRHIESLTWLSNKFLLIALFGSVVLQMIIVYTPLNALFHIVALGLIEWAILIAGIVIGYFSAIWLTGLIVKYVKD